MNATPPTDLLAARQARPTLVHYYVLASLLVITSINYIQRNAIGPAEVNVRNALGVTKVDTGALMTGFFLGYALFQVPSGWLAQRWGARRALSFYAAGWSSVMVVTALSPGFFGVLASRVLLGVLQAGIFPCATLVLASWYPRSQRGLASALLNSFMLLGGTICTVLTGFCLRFLDWRLIFALYAVPGLAWAAWFAWWFRDDPHDHPGVNAAELAVIQDQDPDQAATEDAAEGIVHHPAALATTPAPAETPQTVVGPAQAEVPDEPQCLPTPWAAILLSLPLWLVCVQQTFRAGANRFYDNWLPTYFREARGGDAFTAGLLSSLPLAAGIVGGIVGGWLSDYVLARTGSRVAGRKGVAIASLLVGSTCFFLAYPIANVWVATLAFSAGVFITTFASPCAYALTMDMGGKHVGIVFGIMNMAGNFGSAAFVQVVPYCERWGGWNAALVLFVGLHLAAAVCWALLNPETVIGEKAPGRTQP